MTATTALLTPEQTLTKWLRECTPTPAARREAAWVRAHRAYLASLPPEVTRQS